MGTLRTELTGGIFTIAFDNEPDGFLTGEMTRALLELVPRLAQNDVRCVILTGAVDGVFIRHYSVEELLALSDALRAKGLAFDETTPVDDHANNKIARALESLDKPVIAAINGHAMGGGWELAMACDIRIVEAGDYSLGLPEANLGILPGAGGTQRLARLVGTARALEMILNGRTVGPDEAVTLGLAHECVPDALAHARQMAESLAAKPAATLAHIKRLVRGALPEIEPTMVQLESRLFLELATGDEANGRMRRFVDEKGDIRRPG